MGMFKLMHAHVIMVGGGGGDYMLRFKWVILKQCHGVGINVNYMSYV